MQKLKLDLKTLGFPQLFLNGNSVELGLRKAIALLVYLVETEGRVGRDIMGTLLWPEANQETVRARLRRTLYKIRVAFGTNLIEADRDTLRFESRVEVTLDARHFEKACNDGAFAGAARLYKNDYLSGFALDDSPEFEDWAFYRREGLRSRLTQALERLVEADIAQGEYGEALASATRLLALDPLNEAAHRHVIRIHLLAGQPLAAERQYDNCVNLLRDELGIAPAQEIKRLLTEISESPAKPSANQSRPKTFYVASNNLHIAYQTLGEGKLDIVLVPGFVSHVERAWEDARCRSFLTALSGLGRLIIFDRRGVGLSDRVGMNPTVEATSQDITAVMDAVGSRKALLIGASEGGPGCIHLAASAPNRLVGLVLYGSLAKGSRERGYPYAMSRNQYDIWLKRLIGEWGGPAELAFFAPSFVGDRQAENWWAGLLRSASSPGAIKGVLEALRDLDVRPLLPEIEVPTLVIHRRGDRAIRSEAGRYLAQAIPGARFVELDGKDHWFWAGDQQSVLREITDFTLQLEKAQN
ncbi:alpha/beta fold hydrolase [Pelagibius sp. Alg239-R121]|uniref:alpha/beta fold hydrolase n=1 Tax=Pelagibius sp. Alg239-R121 TaxID=2993448 RepID=UPI0024A61871|nr:alpha/beta fold hydrolase [Pelagibius sp. Alg239-R121]